MSSNVNKVMLLGHLGQKPEVRYTAKGYPVTSFTLATNREYTTAEGISKVETFWHRANIWGKRAEVCAKYLEKGSKVFLEGEMQEKKWTDKTGQPRKSTEILVEKIQFLGGPRRENIPVKEHSLEEQSAPAFSQ